MRVPIRKPGKYTHMQLDLTMTQAQLDLMKAKLIRVKQSLPKAIRETQQYGENGDFSENAEYQIAKGKLRGLNRQVEKLQYEINRAIIIQPTTNTDTVQIGHSVTINTPTGDRTFKILGSTETNPSAGIISYQSPLGAVLLGHQVGDIVTMNINNRQANYTILAIH